MANDNFKRNCDFLGITPADVFFKACEEEGFAPRTCQAVEYSVEVDYDSPAGINDHFGQFNVLFEHDGEVYEAYPSFDWPENHAPIAEECMNDWKQVYGTKN